MESNDQQSSVADTLREIQRTQALLLNAVESLSGRPVDEAGVTTGDIVKNLDLNSREEGNEGESPSVEAPLTSGDKLKAPSPAPPGQRQQGLTSRIILTTYPKQIGINPLPMDWGNSDPVKRGPIVVSRAASTIRRRNAVGVSLRRRFILDLLCPRGSQQRTQQRPPVCLNNPKKRTAANKISNRPDFTNTEPAANIGPFPQWGDHKKIVAMDPWGHLAPWLFKDTIEKDNGIHWNTERENNVTDGATSRYSTDHCSHQSSHEAARARGKRQSWTIVIPPYHSLRRSPIDNLYRVPDGKVCLNEMGELAVTKFAVEPVWYLPGVAERFGIDEATLRRSLFEHTGGSYPELITRGDIKVFLPPIGGLTVYCFGDPAKMSDESVRLSLRVHDECNGSDVFGSDICTCRPYLIFGIEEAVKEAQNGGSGVVIYFRKEGRALGEVTKMRKSNRLGDLGTNSVAVVYNARKRGADRASDYFKRTENIAGVKDMRFQALMPDILHWLGIKKIDRMLSMSK
ncbi:hypothetical protein ACHAPJ_004581 [Fusarium lateritium]